MPVVGSLANASARGLGWGLFASEGNAFELVKPSSVVVTGGGSETATISALGSVEFSAAATLSLNDVFSSGYDNYMIVVRHSASASSGALYARLRLAGTDATGTDYVRQYLYADSTSVTAARETSGTYFRYGGISSVQRSGAVMYLYGPSLAQPTAARDISAYGYASAAIIDAAGTHSLSTAYDGFTLLLSSGTFEGRVAVYGMRG